MELTRTTPDLTTREVSRLAPQLIGLLAATLALALAAAPAAAQISSASVTTSGSTGNGEDSDGSRRSTVTTQTNNGTTLATRFAWNISADVGVFSTRDTNGIAQHNLSFNVTAPGAYFLTVATQRVGIVQRNNDASGCDGAADITGVTGSHTGGTLTSGSFNLGDPGSIGNGGSTTNFTMSAASQSSTARIDRVSNGASLGHSLAFTWSGSTRSNSCEAAVRMGEGSGVSGCDACSYPGDPSRTQSGDGHFVTVTLTSLCGNGVVDSGQGEQCDTGIGGSVCCTSTCQFASASSVCRGSAGVCDVPENCTGSSATCPANQFVSSSVPCRGSAGVCDVVENCTGSSATCPADGFASSSTPCRSSAGVCDVVENCTGSSAACPANGFASSSTPCRPSAGVCDVAENCTGSSATCPANQFVSSSTPCRGSAGVCDLVENCTGSAAACPADLKSSALCRGAADVCDAAENCDGVDDDCPADLVQPSSLECRGSGGVCDLAENCDGVNVACPADVKSTAECRGSAGDCDVAESCDGVGNDCPADVLQPATLECRGSAGICDVAENCTGADPTCPVDGFEPATTECRGDAGDCDVAESCTGSDAACPVDAFEPDGTSCSDGNECSLDDQCVEGACVGNSMLCGDGTFQESCAEECDDGNLDANDGCSPTCLVEPGLGCTQGPLSGCRLPFVGGKSSLLLVKKGGIKDLIKWKWLKGERTTREEYDDPLTSNNYQLCIYDGNGLKFTITSPAGGTCAGKNCWKATGLKGFAYGDKELSPDGSQKLQLKVGALGKAQIGFSGRGANLGMPADLSALVQPIRVQLQNSEGLCWEAVYSGPPTVQSSTKFSDKAD